LGQAFGWLAWPFLVWTTGIVEGVAALPFAAFDTGSLPLWLMVVYYVLLSAGAAYLVQPPSRRVQLTAQLKASLPKAAPLWPLAPLAFIAALIWVAALSQPDGHLHVTFLDVGQGDATLVKTPSGQLLVIDGGPSPTIVNDAVSRSLPFYKRDIALAVLTRATDEKMAGLVSLLERYHVARLTAPGALPRSATAVRFRQLLAHARPAARPGRRRGAGGRARGRRRRGPVAAAELRPRERLPRRRRRPACDTRDECDGAAGRATRGRKGRHARTPGHALPAVRYHLGRRQ
jgi:hypothetical protein